MNFIIESTKNETNILKYFLLKKYIFELSKIPKNMYFIILQYIIIKNKNPLLNKGFSFKLNYYIFDCFDSTLL